MAKATNKEYRDQPMYWFALLNVARERHDFAGVAEAKQNLERLGVRVTFSRPRSQGAEAAR